MFFKQPLSFPINVFFSRGLYINPTSGVMSPLLLTGDGKHFEAIQRRGEVERESRAGGNPRNPLRFFFRLENITTTNNSKKQQLRLHNSVTKRINEVFLVIIFNPKISIQRKRTGFSGGAEDIFGKRSPLCESTL